MDLTLKAAYSDKASYDLWQEREVKAMVDDGYHEVAARWDCALTAVDLHGAILWAAYGAAVSIRLKRLR